MLIGSRALSYWHPQYIKSQNSDFDIVANHEVAEYLTKKQLDKESLSWKDGNVEIHNVNYFLYEEIRAKYQTKNTFFYKDIEFSICSSRGLAIIKRSHLFREIKFASHIQQYQYLDRDFNKEDLDVINRRIELIKKHFPKKVPPQNISNKEFFNDHVKRVFKHDLLHNYVAHYTEPLYTKIKLAEDYAQCDINLWEQLSFQDKVRAVLEECYVLALERYLIPLAIKGERGHVKTDCYKALEKICTTINDGFFRDFAIENWQTIVNQFDFTFITNFWSTDLWQKRS